jgi:hypothetical protein
LVFKEPPLNVWRAEELYEWCDQQFKDDFLNPLMNFCETPEKSSPPELKLKRTKRLAFITMGIIALISVAVSTTVGITTSSIIASNKVNTRIDTLEKQQIELLEKLEQMRNNEMKIKEILQELQKEIMEMGSMLQAVSESMNLLTANLPRTMYYVSNIAARFLLVKDRLLDVSRKWKSNKIDEKILDIFNFSLPCEPHCSLETAEPLSCKIDVLRETISMIFDVKNLKPNVFMMLADPFVLYKRPENKTIVCTKVYSGPKSVIYDQSSDCVTSLPSNQDSYLNLVLVPDTHECKSNSPMNISAKFWKSNECEEKHVITVEDIFQIKQMGNLNYIYCESFIIHVYDQSIACPNFVFNLPTSVSFNIGNLKFLSNHSAVDSDVKFIPTFSQRINFFLTPLLHDFDFNTFDKQVQSDLEKLETFKYTMGFLEKESG